MILTLLCMSICQVAEPAVAPPPNVVLILADDLGWADLACQGSDWYETPRLDSLAKEGMRFTDAYASAANCAPTRAALLSGQWGARTGVWTVGSGKRGKQENRAMVPPENQRHLAASVLTIAEVLRAKGYATGFVGKWHLGNDESGTGPRQQGFDFAIGGDLRGHPKGHLFPWGDMPGLEDGEPGDSLTERLTDEAIGFVRRSQKKPFFLLLSHYAVHTPLQALAKDKNHFESKVPSGKQNNPIYAGMVAELDRQTGRLLDELQALGLDENTLVIFTSDNGGLGGYKDAGVGGSREVTHNAPLRGGKGMLSEGGIRVPLLMRWPKKIQPGTTSAMPVSTLDFYPTLLALSGTKPPTNHPLDGHDLFPLFSLRTKVYGTLYRVWHFPGYLESSAKKGTWRATPSAVIRQGRWKLHEDFTTGKVQLFDLSKDIQEAHDLAVEDKVTATRLLALLRQWREETQAPMPTEK